MHPFCDDFTIIIHRFIITSINIIVIAIAIITTNIISINIITAVNIILIIISIIISMIFAIGIFSFLYWVGAVWYIACRLMMKADFIDPYR